MCSAMRSLMLPVMFTSLVAQRRRPVGSPWYLRRIASSGVLPIEGSRRAPSGARR
ncbi:MAG: hypothetical protein MZV64_72610 [Ignavibacteriales bacterium]|nr:hypothetical protein [Ignavibacteriales bacterium]